MAPSSMYLIEEILRTAREAGASDVHLSPGTPPRMRVNGVLSTMHASKIMPADTLDILIAVLPESQREKFEERGEYDFSFSVPGGGRCRASAYREKDGIALALRLVDTGIPSPGELGIPESVLGLSQRKQGLVLVAGPSGSGKSTTLAAIINQVNEEREALIITLERPVEFLHQHKRSMVNQREIGQDSESYAGALTAALREDPDVILVGDLCDSETADGTIAAAEAGHLVLAGINATSATNAVERVIAMYPPHRQDGIRAQLADALEAVVFQRLISGGDGGRRTAVFEVLPANEETRRLIRRAGMHGYPTE